MIVAAVFAFMLAGAALVGLGTVQRRAPATDPGAYLRSLDDGPADEFEDRLAEPFLSRVAGPIGRSLIEGIGRITPVAQRDRVRQQLVLAGLSGTIRAEDFMAVQLLSAGAGVIGGLAFVAFAPGASRTRLLVAVLLVVAGVLLPKSWLTRKVDDRKEQIFLDLPDVLDLLAISVEAGVGFEGALEIVCNNFDSPLAVEFSRTLKEMELGLPRREALQNLKRRTEVPELSNFVLALVQADALGMPIGRVLHTQAGEMRLKRRQWAREKAGKLPVKILFPLVLFIFPAILIVVLGPAGATIGKNLR